MLSPAGAVLSRIFPTEVFLHRPALRHGDLGLSDALFDLATGQMTGLVDFEEHAVLPAFLAADYVDWLGSAYEQPDDQPTIGRLAQDGVSSTY
jgi:hypothetical protein